MRFVTVFHYTQETRYPYQWCETLSLSGLSNFSQTGGITLKTVKRTLKNRKKSEKPIKNCLSRSQKIHFGQRLKVWAFCWDLSIYIYCLNPVRIRDQDSLLVKRRNDNHSPGPVIRELVPSSHQRSELSNTILCIFSE